MERIQFIEHKGRKLLYLNFANCAPDEILATVVKAKATIASQPRESVYTLTDVTNAGFNSKVSEALKEFVIHNKPYVKAAGVVGVTGLRQIIYNAVMKLSGRKLTAFDTMAEAKDWLAQQ